MYNVDKFMTYLMKLRMKLRVKIKQPWDKIRFQISRHPLTKIIIMQKQLQLCKFILDWGVENAYTIFQSLSAS